MAFRTNKMPVLQEKSASGSVASFNTALAMPLPSCKIAVNAWQEGSGEPSPSNPRPISGYSAINISATGKNLLRINKNRVATDNGVIFTTNDDMSESISGELLGVAVCRVSILVSLKAGTYILTGCPSGGGYSDYVLRIENSSNVCIALDTGNGTTFTIANDQLVYCRIYIYSQNGIGKTFYPMVRMVNTNSDYEPFGTYTTINIGQTVYGGEYDARTGVLTVTHKIKSIDSSSQIYHGEGTNVFYINDFFDTAGDTETTDCNYFVRAEQNYYTIANVQTYMEDKAFTCAIPVNRLFIKNTDWSSLSDFLTWLGSGHIDIAIKLATPIEIPLGGINLLTQQGQNNIFADTGDIDLTYKDLDIAKRGNFREVFRLPS